MLSTNIINMDTKKVLTGMAAAAAGIYLFLNDEDSKPVREKSKTWMLKAKSEIAEKLEAAEEVSEEKYHEIVSEVMSNTKTSKKQTKLKKWFDYLKIIGKKC